MRYVVTQKKENITINGHRKGYGDSGNNPFKDMNTIVWASDTINSVVTVVKNSH